MAITRWSQKDQIGINDTSGSSMPVTATSGIDYKAIIGTHIPNLDSNGFLPNQFLNPITTKNYVVQAVSDMLALTGADMGDSCYVLDDSTLYKLYQTPASDINNWKIISNPNTVISVFGRPGPNITAQSGDYNTDQITQLAGATNNFYADSLVESYLENSAVGKTINKAYLNNVDADIVSATNLKIGAYTATKAGGSTWFSGGRFSGNNGTSDVLLDYSDADVSTFLSSTASTKTINNANADTLTVTNFAVGDSTRDIGGAIEFVSGKYNGYNGTSWKEFVMAGSSPSFGSITISNWCYLASDSIGTVYDTGGNKRTGIEKVSGHQMCLVTNNSSSTVIRLGYWDNPDITAGTTFTVTQEWSAFNNTYQPASNNSGSIGASGRYWANAYVTTINTSTLKTTNLLQNLPTSAPADATVGTTAGNAMLYTNTGYSSLLAKVRTSSGYSTITLSGATPPLTTYRITPRDIQVFEAVAGNEITWPVRYDSDGVYAIREAQTSSFITAIIINPRFLKDSANYQPSLLQVVYKVAAANYTSLTLSVYKYVYTTGQASPTETLVAGEVNMSTGATATVTIAGLDLSAITMDPNAIYVALIKGTPSSSTSKFYFYNARLQFTPAS